MSTPFARTAGATDERTISSLVQTRQLGLDLPEPRGGAVPLGRDELEPRGPLDPHVRVVVGEAPLDRGVVVGGAAVEHVGHLAQDAEAVGKADRDVQQVEVLVAQLEALPATEARRARADIHHHVEDRPAGAAHQLGHPVPGLEVHAAHHPAARAGVVVLHEVVGDAELRESGPAVALEQEAALVSEYLGSDEDGSLEPGLKSLHRAPQASRKHGRHPRSRAESPLWWSYSASIPAPPTPATASSPRAAVSSPRWTAG